MSQPYQGFLDAMNLNVTSLCMIEQETPQIRALPIGVRKRLQMVRGDLDREARHRPSTDNMQIPVKVREYLDALPLGVRVHLHSLSGSVEELCRESKSSEVAKAPVVVKDENQEKEIEKLKKKLKEKAAENASLISKLDDKDKKLAQSIKDNEAKSQEIKDLHHVVENVSRNFQTLKDTLVQKESELRACHDEIKAKKDIIHKLESKIRHHEKTIAKLQNLENFHVERRIPLYKKAAAFKRLVAGLHEEQRERVREERAGAMSCRKEKLRSLVRWKQCFMDSRAEELDEVSSRYKEIRAKMSRIANELVPLGAFISSSSSSSPSIRRSFERSMISLREGFMDVSKYPPRTAGEEEEKASPPSYRRPGRSQQADYLLNDSENQLANCMTPTGKLGSPLPSPGDLHHTPIATDRTREIVQSPQSKEKTSVQRNVPKDLIRWLQRGNLSSTQ
ncbi:hypothetical protein GUITHDRAFT_162883 [Guillardia theta CCMP2712]|uniref:Uncharacterized protein n=1 Tax=Guillardia theta (strain CCMP2712) TaxID=905079 RepID=L1JDI7_GUITC|nr:hypothetical protein GUITHDRAFT_162883 [Guillardia theta CCMP2712]EKX46603.1 hypothetical protein GUITHDRAFT_162883 [Guillardia theta CCMP2712]|eukprot:XP_005833583.1 hypothetical protein GUITHDRAFT_162883 [Guillardia theta CCMP2712]